MIERRNEVKEFHIVYITDSNYVMPTCISIVSLKMSRIKPANYHIYVLANEISMDSKEKILSVSEENFEIQIIDVKNDKYEELAKTCLTKDTPVTYSALYKFDIANILKTVDKVLYLDGDTLINKDISELLEIDMSDMYVAAADEMGDEYTFDGESMLATRIGLCNQTYFNSGVLLFNLYKMRQDRIQEQLIEYRREKINYFMDQDAINSVMGKRRIKLSYCYNFRTALFDVMDIEEISNKFFEGRYTDIKSCLQEQSIIHLSDRLKPWKYNFPWITDIFLYFYAKSPYRRERINFLSPLKVLNDRKKEIEDNYIRIIEYYQNACDNYERRVKKMVHAKVWKFPYNKIKKGSKIVLYGAGRVGNDLYEQAVQSEFCQVVLWVDKDYLNKRDEIISPEKIKNCEYDCIVIALAETEIVKEVEKYLKSLGVEEEKIVRLKEQ